VERYGHPTGVSGLPFHIWTKTGFGEPKHLAGFDDYKAARRIAMRRVTMKAKRQCVYASIKAGDKTLFEVVRHETEGLDGKKVVKVIVETEILP